MPDPERKTVSASQLAALYGRSPYETEFTLYHQFVNPDLLDDKDNLRMEAGRRFEPVILQWAAEEMGLDVEPHDQTYTRHPVHPIGTTHDANVREPNRGDGVVEAKNVDRLIYAQQWTDTLAPEWIEIQVQGELLALERLWGVIAACVGGNELKLLEREPIPEMQAQMIDLSNAFLARVNALDEPSVVGTEKEIAVLSALYDEERMRNEGAVIDLREEEQGEVIAGIVEEFESAKKRARDATKIQLEMRTHILQAAESAQQLLLPENITVYIKTSERKGFYVEPSHTTRITVK